MTSVNRRCVGLRVLCSAYVPPSIPSYTTYAKGWQRLAGRALTCNSACLSVKFFGNTLNWRSTKHMHVLSGASTATLTVSDEFVSVAQQLADIAATITVPHFRTQIAIDTKQDASPVTVADRAAEDAMRKHIAAVLPEHAVFGEEQGLSLGVARDSSDFVWVLDPIDGTKSFITGKPLFGTLIALLHRGTPVLGIIDQPVLKERWLGVVGRPTTLNGQLVGTRSCDALSSAYMYSTTPLMFTANNEKAYLALAEKVASPLYGCDCYAYGLLACGYCDLVVEADLKPYDYMALVPVVEGAGGLVTDWQGHRLVWSATPEAAANVKVGEVLAAGDPTIHAEAVTVLQANL